jgi:hypothetical protein
LGIRNLGCNILCSTTQGWVCPLDEFKHYSLDNFIFHVDHMALVYMVNKTLWHVYSKLIVFLDYNFTIVYKLGLDPYNGWCIIKIVWYVELIGVPT